MAEKFDKLSFSKRHLDEVVERGIGSGAIMLNFQENYPKTQNAIFDAYNPLDFEGPVTVEDYTMDTPRKNLLFALRINHGGQPEEPNTIFDRALMALARIDLPLEALQSPEALEHYILSCYPNLRK